MSRFECSVRAAIVAALLVSLPACSSDKKDKPSPAAPSGITVSAEHSSLWIGQQTTITAQLLYGSKTLPACAWYVNGVPGGGTEIGTIEGDNPAVYIAPLAPPPGGQVEIKAVWSEDETVDGTATVSIGVPDVHVHMTESRIQVEDTLQILASLEAAPPRKQPVAGRQVEFEWYVDGIPGGDESVGTITTTNPAVYTAPRDIPQGGTVQIKAAWTALAGYEASQALEIVFTIKHVDAQSGLDAEERGRRSSPYRTISYALGRVVHGDADTILVAPGVYGPDLGEQSGNTVRWGTTLRGMDRDECIIDANPEPDLYSSTVFYLSSNSTIENLTIRNSGPDSQQLYAIEIQGPGTVRNVRIQEPFLNSAIRVMNPGVEALIEDCLLDNTFSPDEGWGLRLSEESRTILRNTTVRGWDYGILVSSSMANRIEACDILDNRRGVMIDPGDVHVDLGGGGADSAGGNTIQNNGIGVYNKSDNTIYARHNTWGSAAPQECAVESDEPCDIYNAGSGSVIWE